MHSFVKQVSSVGFVILGLAFSLVGQEAAVGASYVAGVPTPAHVVIVMEENHGYSQIIGSSQAPYINTLASEGALFTASYATAHPSQPNYLELFSGGNQGVLDDSCPHTFSTPTLESELIAKGKSFAGYSEGLPAVGSEVCVSGAYVRKHAPWTDFTKDPGYQNKPFSSFPATFANLPAVSFVIPNLNDDMHDGTIQQGDSWLQHHLLAYANWARSNNSLLIVTFDEDQGTTVNHIATIFVGAMVKPGKYSEYVNHYRLLRTLEDMYGVGHLGSSAFVSPITDVWK
jgi:acid phosphatase